MSTKTAIAIARVPTDEQAADDRTTLDACAPCPAATSATAATSTSVEVVVDKFAAP